MCLKRREALSLGSFAERVRSCLNLPAAAGPCKNVLLHPFLNAFPAGKAWETGVGPRGLSACSAFCRDQSNS